MKAIIDSFDYCLDFLREQVSDISEPDFVAQPNGILNHPAWVIGHLTGSCQALGREIGVEPWLPENWAARFGTGSRPVLDLSVYESGHESLQILRDAQSRITDSVLRLPPVRLDLPLNHQRYGPAIPTVRHAIVQMLVAHSAYHVGQLTLWRNQMGMKSLGRSFL